MGTPLMAVPIFRVFASLYSPGAVDALVAGLVRLGFRVDPLAQSNRLTWDSDHSSFACIRAEYTGPPQVATSQWCCNQAEAILRSTGRGWFCIVVCDHASGESYAWSGPETPPKTEKAVVPPASPTSSLDRVDAILDKP